VKQLKQYRIPFSGLNAGKHKFEFDIDKKFFDCFEHSIVKDGNLKAEVQLQKQENMLIVNFDIKGDIQLTCDVCLSDFDAPTEIKERVIVKFTEEDWQEETEEVIVLTKSDHELDIANLLYEYINLAVPFFAKCKEQGKNLQCDPEMLSRLTTAEETEETEETTIDPRWEALRNIKNN